MIATLSAVAGLVVIALLAVALYLLSQAKKTRIMAQQVEAAVPPQGQYVQISTGRLHFTDIGTGRPVLLIHGLGGQLRTMTLALTSALGRQFRVIAVDRPGMGYSDRPEEMSATIEAQAGYMEEVIDRLNLQKPIVVGHSLGGAIAAQLALRAPEKVAGLALIAPLLRASSKSSTAFAALGVKNPRLRRFLARTLAVPAMVKNQDVTRTEIFGPDPVPTNYTRDGGGLLSLRPKSFLNTSRDYCAVGETIHAQAERYDELKMPVRILYGTEDRILDHVEQGIDMAARYPHMHLELIEGAGHMLVTNHVDAVVRTVEAVAEDLAPRLVVSTPTPGDVTA
ncbi:alpha/beta fold hydrolase [Maritimibacter sp. DP1N21-5]|uniref:alpha/beta fold hydrolase n=1 Tax=Maritimibacter sp. DP1N21-5 TaxID=2836867 RepID=UPI001C484834|nr:alpha/beta fold hydrolase [Maritimibacter sp. DP1N21-5]MBV7409995.1 alpha/beta fold hydrolase [Maritimibacter sp. DP1N21-5]